MMVTIFDYICLQAQGTLITHRIDSHLTYVPQCHAKFRTSYCMRSGVLKAAVQDVTPYSLVDSNLSTTLHEVTFRKTVIFGMINTSRCIGRLVVQEGQCNLRAPLWDNARLKHREMLCMCVCVAISYSSVLNTAEFRQSCSQSCCRYDNLHRLLQAYNACNVQNEFLLTFSSGTNLFVKKVRYSRDHNWSATYVIREST